MLTTTLRCLPMSILLIGTLAANAAAQSNPSNSKPSRDTVSISITVSRSSSADAVAEAAQIRASIAKAFGKAFGKDIQVNYAPAKVETKGTGAHKQYQATVVGSGRY